MANPNDRIFKENFFINFLPIIEKILGLEQIERTKEITEKLQHTMEREPDFVRIVETKAGNKYILHLEFQTTNDKNMLLRMGEYHSLLMRRYDFPIKHFVLYFGNAKPTMQTQLPEDKVFRGFELKNLKDFSYSDFTESENPEEVVMGILADFEDIGAEAVIEKTLLRLVELTRGGTILGKYVEQLTILSGLRKLEEETKQKVEEMAITIDLNRNPFYKEAIRVGKEEGIRVGKEEGIKEGIKEGRKEGIEQRNEEFAKHLLEMGEFTEQKISQMVGLSIEKLAEIKRRME